MLSRCLPTLNENDLHRRLNFVVGALTYSMAEVVWEHGDSADELVDLADRLTDFAEAGLTAPSPERAGTQARFAAEVTL